MLRAALLFFILFGRVLGQEYVIRHQLLSSGSLYNLENVQRERLGWVVREKKGGSFCYSYFDDKGNLTAKGISSAEGSSKRVKITDCDGGVIGSFSSHIYDLSAKEYLIFGPQNNLIAQGSMNWVGSAFSLASPRDSEQIFVHFFRPMFRLFNDHWHFDVREERLDLSLLTILGVVQTGCDLNWEMYEARYTNLR